MTLEQFAKKYRLRIRTNKDDGTEVIAGSVGHIYEYDEGELGVMYFPGRWSPKTWGNIKRKAAPLGMTVRQNGDSEGALSFDPTNRAHAKLAISAVRCRPKRQVSPETIARLAEMRRGKVTNFVVDKHY